MDRLFEFIFLAGLAAFHAALMWVIWDKSPAPLPERVFVAMEMDD